MTDSNRVPVNRVPVNRVPVIAIDGPTASGKGTVAQAVARALGFHYLDSGALYRLTALAAARAGLAGEGAERGQAAPAALAAPVDRAAQPAQAPVDVAALAELAGRLPVSFQDERILLAGEDVTDAIRTEAMGNAASRLSVHPAVREALLRLQRDFRRSPGLVADGRDMGTVVFPDARLKVFLTASAESRAKRRHKQLSDKGFSAKLPTLLQDLLERDERDRSRASAPLRPAEDAWLLDSTALSVSDTVAAVLHRWSGLA